MIIHFDNNSNFKEEIKEGKVIVDFFATWCGPCQMLGPVLEEVANNRSDVKIIKIDVDQFEDLSREFSVMSVPTLLFYENGQLTDRKTGYMTVDEINNLI